MFATTEIPRVPHNAAYSGLIACSELLEREIGPLTRANYRTWLECRERYLEEIPDLNILIQSLRGCLFQGGGYIIDDCAVDGIVTPQSITLATLLVSLCSPLEILEPSGDYWAPLTVKLAADPIRTHGTGRNDFHIDFLTKPRPPRLIAFLCIRPDPLGGGQTLLSDLQRSVAALDEESRAHLMRPSYRYWDDTQYRSLGEGLTAFSIIPHPGHEQIIRFTSKMLVHLDTAPSPVFDGGNEERPAAKSALMALKERIDSDEISFHLQPGQLLIFDQWRYAHARSELAPGQEQIPEESRRLLLQGYAG